MAHTHAHTHNAANFTSQRNRQKDVAERLEAKRKAAIKAVKVCQRQLQMDDATYRAMLTARTGKASATELSLNELSLILNHLRRAGAINPKGASADGRRRTVPVAARADLMAKVHALLRELGQITGQPYSMAYADAICARNNWCTRVDFADPQTLHLLVGALSRTVRAKQRAANKAA